MNHAFSVSRIKCIVLYILSCPTDAYRPLSKLAIKSSKQASTCALAVPSPCNVHPLISVPNQFLLGAQVSSTVNFFQKASLHHTRP